MNNARPGTMPGTPRTLRPGEMYRRMLDT